MGANISFFLREVVQDFRRRKLPLIAFILCLALLLLFLSILSGAGLEMGYLSDRLRGEAQVSVFLKDGVTDQETKNLTQLMGKWPGVLEVRVVSKDQALASMTAIMGGKDGALTSFEGYNPFLSFVELQVIPEKSSLAAENARQLPQTDWVRDNQDIMKRLLQLTNVLKTVRFLTTAFVGLMIMIVAAYLVHLGIAVRHQEMEVYRLLGASEGFVAAPFLLEGALLGLAAGIVAALTSLLLFPLLISKLQNALPFLPMITGNEIALINSPFLILAGLVFSTLGSLIALRQ